MNIPSVKQLDWPLALLGLAILMLVNINLVFNSLQGIDHALYDQQLQSLAVKADDKILIVEIDEQSLSLLGQWPWPRSYHGQMIELLTQADAGVIAYNVVFSNWSGDKEDQALASAIEKSGRTVLPLYFDRVLKQGKVAEVLPAEPLRESAVLGHVNSYLDLDGKLRSVRLVDTLFNEEEVSEARLHFSYASFLFNQPYSPLLELDLREVLIPFVTEEDYQRVSFVDLLTGQVSADQISQRSVFVGVTATSMGDPLLTPADDDGRQSPAVDINANIYQALASSSYILPLPLVMAILINSIFIVLTVVLIPRLSGLQQAGLTLMSLCLAWLISYLLLAQGYWYASGGLLVALIVIPFIWNILRLSRLFRFLRQQLKQLRQQQASDSFRLPGQGKIADHKQLERLMSLLDISQYQVLSQDAYQESSKGSQQDLTLGLLKSLSIQIEGKQQVLTICFENYTQVEKRKLNLLTSLLQNTRVNHINAQSHSVADVFNKQLVLIDGFQHQLNLSHSLFSASIEGVAAGILVVDLYGQVLFSNDSLTKLVQQKIDNLAQLIPLVQLHNVNWSELLRDVLIHQQAKHIEARVEDKDLSISVRCVEGLQESQAQEVLLPPLIVLNISDISEIKQAHRSRNEMIDFLSHDLRSPMASLQALVSQARTGQLVELDVVHLLDKVDHYSQRGLNFAEQFLDLAKLEGEQDIPLYEVDLYSIAQNALDTVYHQAQEKAIRLTLQADDDVWTYSNGELLERVLLNLLTNAVKYSPKHSEIWIKVMAFNNTVQLEVIDQGPGISAELAPVLFKPYARGKDSNTQQAKGVGLGLRFVDVALKRLQSQIQFDCASKEDINPGTRFYFQLEKLDFS